jgi:hypothetical protein
MANNLPQARLPISEDGTTFSLPWLRFFQGLSSGTIDPAVIAALEAEIAAAEAAAAAAQVTANEALVIAEEAGVGITTFGLLGISALDVDFRKKLFGFGFERDLTSGTLGQSFLDFSSKISWLIPAGIPNGSVKTTGVGPSIQTDFDLQVASISVGTISFAASATEATLIASANIYIASDVTINIVIPASLNGMTGRLFGSIVGTQI